MGTEDKNEEKVWRKLGLGKHVSASVAAFLVIAASVLFAFCLVRISTIIRIIVGIIEAATPIIYGICIAYILKPIYNRLQLRLEKHFLKHMKKPEKADSLSKGISSIAVVLLLVLVIIAVMALLIPELYNSVVTLTDNLPTYIDNARSWLHGALAKYPSLDETAMSYFDKFTNMTSEFVEELFPGIGSLFGMVTSGLGDMFGFIYNIFIGMIVAIYLLNEKDTLTAQFRKLGYAFIKTSHISWVREELRYADKMFSGYVFARFLDSILLGLVYSVLGVLFQIPFVGMISVVVGITNMIPFFGPYIGAVPCTIILVLISPIEALKFIVIDLVIMQLDANLISPKIIGNSTGLSGFWVLFAILFFGGLWGFIGMLIGVPLFAVLYHLIGSLIDRRLARKDMETNIERYIREPRMPESNSKLKEMMKKVDKKEQTKENVEEKDGGSL